MSGQALLEAKNLTVNYRTKSGDVTAVSDISFQIEEGEYIGIVGESGCGKTTLANALLGILDDNGYIAEGSVRYKGEEISEYTPEELNKKVRWKEISVIPQGAHGYLDPLERISDQAIELAQVHTDMNEEEIIEKSKELFSVMGIKPERVFDYPHQFSGGMQQRTLIALSLLLDPSLIVADEPTTALDVIMQDQIFDHLEKIKQEYDVSIVLITHDVAVVFENCDTLAIMHSGQLCEYGLTKELFDNPRHPYSILLQAAIPDLRNLDAKLAEIEGYPPQLKGDTEFCSFVNRCPLAVPECEEAHPPIEEVEGDTDHHVACIRSRETDEFDPVNTDRVKTEVYK